MNLGRTFSATSFVSGWALLGIASASASFTASGSWTGDWTVTPLSENGDPLPPVSDNDGDDIDLSSGSAVTLFTSSPYQPSTITTRASGVVQGPEGQVVPRIKTFQRIDFNAEPTAQNVQAERLKVTTELSADFSDTISITGFEARSGKLVLNLFWTGRVRQGPTLLSGDFDYDFQGSTRGTAFINGAQQVGTFQGPPHPEQIKGTFNNYNDPPFDTNFLSGLLQPSPFSPPPGPPTQTLIPISEGLTELSLSLNIIDKLSIEVDSPRSDQSWEALQMWAERDFENTLVISLGFQDDSGNWIEDASLTSQSGYTYDMVPEPSSLAAILIGAGMLVHRRRR